MLRVENPDPTAQRMLHQLWTTEFDEHRRTVEATAACAAESFSDVVGLLESSVRRGGKILFFGNGGSAADAQHLVAELVVRYKSDRTPIAALALTTDPSTVTACANDLGYDRIFERQVEALGCRGDVAFGLSTSGQSVNVLKGLRQARAMGLSTAGLCGGTGGDMRSTCDAVIVVPSRVTARIQEMHISIGHMICKALEERLELV